MLMQPMLEAVPTSMTRLSLLVDLSSVLAREVDLDAMLSMAAERVASALRADRATIWLIDSDREDLVTSVAVLPEVPELRQPIGRGLAGFVARTGEVVRVDDAGTDERFDPSADRATGYRTRSVLCAPIREDGRAPVRGVIQVLNRHDGPFDVEDERYLLVLGVQLGRALEMTTLRSRGSDRPGVVLRGRFNHILGRSPSMQAVFNRIALAAQTDATVLIRGETGTGKGLLARAVHVNSPRQSGPFVTVDCTTLPAQLVESELFGHERGAFTGADRRVPGRLEVADGGTVLLDEIGDLPLEMQGKLLRFMQDRTFERVGGRSALRADVRVICATHRDLERQVREGRFREDLYYRIRVVDIRVPPLRDRGAEEIEDLARHFAALYAKRYGRPEPQLVPETLASLSAHAWPGNVRELEHWVESAVVLSTNGQLEARRPPSLPPSAVREGSGSICPLGLTLEEANRRYIVATVAACGGNKTEAARRLEVGRNTVSRAMVKR